LQVTLRGTWYLRGFRIPSFAEAKVLPTICWWDAVDRQHPGELPRRT
jgi:hypothetical protein